MGRPRNPWQRKTDDNHQEIMDCFRAHGFSVFDTARLPKFVDLVAGKWGRNYLIEVKDGSKPKSARKLTEHEQDLHDDWLGEIHIIESVSDVVKFHRDKIKEIENV